MDRSFGFVYIPIKVYRERDRGDNEYYDPELRYEGLDWTSTAMENWINELRQKR